MTITWSGDTDQTIPDPAPHYPPTDPASWWLGHESIAPRPEPRVVGTDPLLSDAVMDEARAYSKREASRARQALWLGQQVLESP